MARNYRQSRWSTATMLSRTNSIVGRQFLSESSMRNMQEIKSKDFIKRVIKKGDNNPTDAYGEIEFRNHAGHTAKYVKVSHNTKPDEIYHLLKNCWNLKAPNLVISVTGREKYFCLRDRLKEVFYESLIKVSESTGAWITTGGTRAGVMKHVGKTVRDYAIIKDDEDRVVTIGIAPWGVIHERDKLVNKSDGAQDKPKEYDAEKGYRGSDVVLDPNHSHFIFVDDGNENKFGTEIAFRTKFESHLSNQNIQHDVKVMIVCIIVQGGPGSLTTVAGSIKNNIPVVIVSGSGGWADVLASAYTMDVESIRVEVVEELLRENNMVSIENCIEEWTELVKTCVSKKIFMSVFELDSRDSAEDLDIIILKALLKADSRGGDQQLKLAMAWNRSDVARSLILNDGALIGKKEIADMFFIALRSNKHEFCKVFLDYGVDLKECFIVKELNLLYSRAPKGSLVYKKMCKKGDFSLQRVGRILVHILGRSYISVYEKRSESAEYEAVVEEVQQKDQKWLSEPWNENSRVDDPYREIFQWAILVNYREIAMHIWEYMFESMSAAIMATKMLKSIAKKMSHNHEEKLLMLKDADQYEKLAIGILDRCFSDNPDKAEPLLINRLRKWGGCTCLRAAAEANDKLFVSRSGVQNLLDAVWMGKLDGKTYSLLLILSGICPPLIWTAIKFQSCKEEDKDSNVPETRCDTEVAEFDAEQGMTSFTNTSTKYNNYTETDVGNNSLERDSSGETKSYSILEKTCIFYSAPIMVFWMNVVAFLAYLVLFALVILSAYRIDSVSVTIYEYILVVWRSAFLLEEIRKIRQSVKLKQERINLFNVLRVMYLIFSDIWKILNISSLILFFLGFCLR